MPVSEAKSAFSEVVAQVRYTGRRVILTRHGKHVAAVVPISDLEKLEPKAA